MKQELLRIFDDNHKPIGIAAREEVHKFGHWHETFHCWFTRIETGTLYLYFQLRSKEKKDYPSLIDITAAGHILADESIEDGTREVQEEIGIHVDFTELILLDVVKYCVSNKDLLDNEIAHVFLYPYTQSFDNFILQEEEVSGIVRAELILFRELLAGKRTSLQVDGFEINQNGVRKTVHMNVDKSRFVPHEDTYYVRVLDLIEEYYKK
ncbi:NUDIX hydrolase [Metabacillus idriensis]|uniref:NUDIX hydrolase n=1 Tax=Metabacillus idriensis TaxID=324768 RepID=UPI00174A5C8F|nr:NUDIX domain-containing protein [Metabacillus idriensis]